MVNYEPKYMTDGTGNYRSGTSINSETASYTVTYPEQEGETESQVPHMTRESSGGDAKAFQEAAYEGET